MTGITFISKSKYLVTPEERERLDWLHYSDGFMWEEFLNTDKIGFVTLAKKNNIIIGWSLVFERNEEKTFFLYVAKDYRKLGIGTKLYQIAERDFGAGLYTSKHNKIATRFYESLGV